MLDILGQLPIETMAPVLIELLHHRQVEIRCRAAAIIAELAPGQMCAAFIPLLADRSPTFRWCLCGLLKDCADPLAVPALVERLQRDHDPQVRGEAAYALGHIGALVALPALIHAVQHDLKSDRLGHTPSSVAADAISQIMLKLAISTVETTSTMTVVHAEVDGIVIHVEITPEAREFDVVPSLSLLTTYRINGFEPPLQPLDAPPFTVVVTVNVAEHVVRGRFVFDQSECEWWVGVRVLPITAASTHSE